MGRKKNIVLRAQLQGLLHTVTSKIIVRMAQPQGPIHIAPYPGCLVYQMVPMIPSEFAADYFEENREASLHFSTRRKRVN